MQISVIIPTLGFRSTVKKLFLSLEDQILAPSEIIIIDSSHGDEIYKLVTNFQSQLPIKYFKVEDFFPGNARNFGIKKSIGDAIAILDSKTIPTKDWLSESMDILVNKGYDVSFGSTCYLAQTSFQKILQACLYGKDPVETTPGSVFLRHQLPRIGLFIEGTRTADDLEWRERINKNNLKSFTHKKYTQTYSNISTNLIQEMKRSFIYQVHSAKLEVQLKARIFILGVGLFLLTLLIPQWNYYFGGILFIPNITKSFFYFLSLFATVILIASQNAYKSDRSIRLKILIAPIFFLLTYFVYQWNEVIANWVEESIYFIPHITKAYIFLLIFMGIVFRGIYMPIRKGISYNYIFPVYWLVVGSIGALLDIVKIPGYLLGALASLIRLTRF